MADVQVPRGILWVILLATLLREGRTDQAIKKFDAATGEFGTFLGTRMREGDQRTEQLLTLQISIERLTRWLVGLTIVVGIIGVGGIAATIWAVVN